MNRRKFLKYSAVTGVLATAVGGGTTIPAASDTTIPDDPISDTGDVLLHLPQWKDDAAWIDADGVLRFNHRRTHERLAALRHRTGRLVVHVGHPRGSSSRLARSGKMSASLEISPAVDPFGHWLLELCRRMEFDVRT